MSGNTQLLPLRGLALDLNNHGLDDNLKESDSYVCEIKQSKKMKKYTVFVAYSLEGKNYTEKPNLKSTHKLFNTPEEAIEAIKNEVEQEYHNKDYRGFEIELPEIKRNEKTGNCWIYSGYFKCAYTFGPIVHYDIYINSIHID